MCVLIRLTASEHEAVIVSARAAGLSVASYLREAGLLRPLRPAPSVIDLRAVQAINRLGNNLNQLLVLTHTHRAPAELSPTIETLLRFLSALHQQVCAEASRGSA